MKLKNNVKGITLIALVVTIIVLLILAGVALNLTIGQNGIFTRAGDVANTWRNAESNEQLAMEELEDWMDSVSGESNNEAEPTYTNIFAQLYSNGDSTETLVFTNDDSYREEGLTYEQSYDITNEHFVLGDSSETSIMPPWIDQVTHYENYTIKTVKIVNEIKPKYASCMFLCLVALENIEGMEKLNTKNTLDMSCMFYGCISISSLDLSSFDTKNVTNMAGMFAICKSLTTLDLSSFDTRNVTDMSSMFLNCTNLSTIYVGPNWITSTNADGTFDGCIAKDVTLVP